MNIPDTPAELLAMLDHHAAVLDPAAAEQAMPPDMAAVIDRYQPRVFQGQRLFRFDNGYGASLIFGSGAYGFELSVIHWVGDDHAYAVYDTPVADDVVGWLTPDGLETLLTQIKALPPRPPEVVGEDLRREAGGGQTPLEDGE